MKRTYKAVCFLILVLIWGFPSPASAQEELSSVDSLLRLFNKRAPGLLARNRVPGAGVAILRKGEIAWTGGFGYSDLEQETPVTGDTVFNVGSVSKTVAAWGAMLLVEEGKLDLDAPIEKSLSRWKLPESAIDSGKVTLRRLLSHTAGLSLHGYPGFQPGEALPTVEASLSGATNGSGGVYLLFEPGTQWKYSGGGYTIAQLAIEEASGLPFAEYMKKNVLLPLGMKSSDYRWTEEIDKLAATPYDRSRQPIAGPRFTAAAAAGLQTSPNEFARFAQASLAEFHDRVEGLRSPLSAASVRTMQTPALASPGYGLGYSVETTRGIEWVGHNGANRGWMARLSLVPKSGDALIVLTNGSRGGAVHSALFDLWIDWLVKNS